MNDVKLYQIVLIVADLCQSGSKSLRLRMNLLWRYFLHVFLCRCDVWLTP